MGGPKTQQTQQQTYNNANTYGYQPGASSADIDAMRGFEFETDPSVHYAFNRARQSAHDSYSRPLAGYSNQQVRDQALRASDEDSMQSEAQSLNEANHNLQGLKYAQKADVAQMTAPRFVQTGGSGTQSGTSTSQTNPGLMGYLTQGISAASNVGSAMLMVLVLGFALDTVVHLWK